VVEVQEQEEKMVVEIQIQQLEEMVEQEQM
jgi:hypothetical protein